MLPVLADEGCENRVVVLAFVDELSDERRLLGMTVTGGSHRTIGQRTADAPSRAAQADDLAFEPALKRALAHQPAVVARLRTILCLNGGGHHQADKQQPRCRGTRRIRRHTGYGKRKRRFGRSAISVPIMEVRRSQAKAS